ncbi:acetyl-CoA carboxylase biotin carboxyl carrier protein [Balneolales bacterium ANBcel1]|nr:acetyl-CoA carboxylase biotin carboxyl carrier protein [Balneolales bacterium ANBcel1]
MDLKTIKNLLNLISDTDVNEVEIEEGDFRIKVKKQPDTIKGEFPSAQMGQPPAVQYQAPAPAPAPQAAPAESAAPTASAETDKDENLITVRSPIVGTFYRAPSPESDPYLNTGDTVSKGDVLCIIEAMKIMNEIESEHTGKVVKILAEEAQPVEFDQPLFLIQPS